MTIQQEILLESARSQVLAGVLYWKNVFISQPTSDGFSGKN